MAQQTAAILAVLTLAFGAGLAAYFMSFFEGSSEDSPRLRKNQHLTRLKSWAQLGQPNVLSNCGEPSQRCELRVGPRIIDLGHATMLTRGFQSGGLHGFPIGPVLRVKPGQTLKLKLINELTEPNPGCAEGQHYCLFNSTNLHTHGLHVSGEPGQDHVLADVPPQGEGLLDIAIPGDHMGGFHFYHAHHHHSTALMVAGGSAGLIYVEDPQEIADTLPDAIKNMKETLMILTLIDAPLIKNIADKGGDQLINVSGNDTTVNIYVNGDINPTVTIAPGEWNRFKMCYSSIEKTIRANFTAVDHHIPVASCEMQLLATDGIYLHTLPRKISGVSMFPGARSDVAVRCQCQPGVSWCAATFFADDAPLANTNAYTGAVFTAIVVGETVASEDLPVNVQVKRPCYLVDLRKYEETFGHDLPNENVHGLKLGKHLNQLGQWWKPCRNCSYGKFFSMRNMPEEDEIQSGAMGFLTPGQPHEIQVKNMHRHPFHIHVNPYQLQGAAADFNDDYFQPGDWHDVMMHPGADSAFPVRTITDRFTGEAVVHCHFLHHEDMGMMGWLWINKTTEHGGVFWEDATKIDPQCFSDQ